MSRKHFEAIALVLLSTYAYPGADPWTKDRIARDLADYFADENPRFDRARFLEACGVEW